MAFRGVDIRQSGDRIVLRASLKDQSGVRVTAGAATLRLFELQSDGTLKSFDFSDNVFKTTALTTPTANLTAQSGNGGAYASGLWTYLLTTLTGFTRGNIYIAQVAHSSASPPEQERELQYGEGEGDFEVSSPGNVTVGAYAAGEDPPTLLLVTPANKLATDFSGRVTVGSNADKSGYALSATAVQAIWDALTAALTTAGSIGSLLVTNLNGMISGILSRLGAPTGASVSADIAQVDADVKAAALAGAGTNSVTLTINDGTNPVVGALVTIKDAGETQILAGLLPTNGGGQVVFNLANGTYHVLIASSPQYATLAAQTLVVAGTTTHTYSLTPFSMGVPSVPGICRVVFTDFLGEDLQAGVTLEANLVDLNSATAGAIQSNQVLRSFTNQSGQTFLDLVQVGQFIRGTGVYQIRATDPNGRITHQFNASAPNLTTCTADTLIPA